MVRIVDPKVTESPEGGSLTFGNPPASPVADREERPTSAMIQVTEIPSAFVPYPEGTKIWYRPYTYRELDTFNDSKLDHIQSLRRTGSGFYAEGMDVQDLTLPDYMYLGLLRRISSLGTSTFTVSPRREDGSVIVTKTYGLDVLQFDDLEAPELPVNIRVGGKVMQFVPLTMRLYEELANLGTRLSTEYDRAVAVAKRKGEELVISDDDEHMRLCKEAAGDPLEENERALLAAECTNLPFEEAWKLICDATGEEMVLLHRVDDILFHGVMPLEVKFLNKETRQEDSISVRLDHPQTLVFPFRKPQDTEESAVWFGV